MGKEKLKELISELREMSELYHNKGIEYKREANYRQAEFHFGVSEGIDYSITELELFLSNSQPDDNAI